jgi:phage terminase Nu1 subunit (DNA packaging protein)
MASTLPSDVTGAELMRLLGVTRPRISQLEADGIVTRTGRDRYELASVPRYIAWLRKGNEGPVAWNRARTELAQERAQMARLERGQLEGRLLERDHVRHMNVSIAHTIKARLLAVPRATAPRLVGLAHATQAEAVTMDAITTALEELAALAFVAEPQPRRRKNVAPG